MSLLGMVGLKESFSTISMFLDELMYGSPIIIISHMEHKDISYTNQRLVSVIIPELCLLAQLLMQSLTLPPPPVLVYHSPHNTYKTAL